MIIYQRLLNMHRLPYLAFICFLSGILLLTGCSGDDEPSPGGDDASCKVVTLLFGSSGLGDAGYNDRILAAASRYCLEHSRMELRYVSPDDDREAEQSFLDWLGQAESDDGDMLVLTQQSYEKIVEKHKAQIDPQRHRIILLDSRRSDLPVHTVYISYYGACYWAGRLHADTGEDMSAAIIKANNRNIVLNEMEAGFRHGIADGGGEITATGVLDDEGENGFDMAMAAYWLTAEFPITIDLIFPIAGGSNMGVYRFTREFPKTFLTVGIDVNQENYSSSIGFSLLKHTDRLIQEYLEAWINGESLPSGARVVGLADGYTDLRISHYYDDYYGDSNRFKNIAIEKEAEYEKTL